MKNMLQNQQKNNSARIILSASKHQILVLRRPKNKAQPNNKGQVIPTYKYPKRKLLVKNLNLKNIVRKKLIKKKTLFEKMSSIALALRDRK